MKTIHLPNSEGRLEAYSVSGNPVTTPKGPHRFNRIAFSAAHIVADPLAATEPGVAPAIDWESTLSYRRHLLDLGLGIAEAMDTAQRGGGLNWEGARELVTRSLEAASPDERDRIFSGVGTDHLDPSNAKTLDDVVRAYLEQIEAIQKIGGRLIVMASRALVRVARSAKDYETVYAKVLSACDKPVILHWLGDMFDSQLKGYWGADRFDETLETALGVISAHAAKVDGIKISLLDDAKEVAMRRRLTPGVKMYTGDDFNYPSLIKGDDHGYSHALLGIFDAIAPLASAALSALAAKDVARYDAIFAPTVPLSRLIFRSPTQYYKTGVVFLAYLNGFQSHFVMVAGAQSMRPLPYFTELFKMADHAGLLRDPDDAVRRMTRLLALYGIEA